MLTKTYTANIVKEGIIIGCVIAQGWIWTSVDDIFEEIKFSADIRGGKPIDFKRVE